jgi:hypothetical protein
LSHSSHATRRTNQSALPERERERGERERGREGGAAATR